MATRGLLHHPRHLRPNSFIADPRHVLPRRSSFPSEGFAATQFRLRLSSTPTLRSVQCMKVEDQAGSKVKARDTPEAKFESSHDNTDVIEYVNKAAPGPMVEVDPVTVFRRIIAERRASLAKPRAKQQAADTAAIQSTAPAPFLLGSKWSGKSMIAIAVALVFLALALVSYYRRSSTNRGKQTELPLSEGEDNHDVSTDDGRRKLVKDTIKAPESVLTAMAIGAASVGRPKGQMGSTQDTPHAENGNLVGTQRPKGGADAKPNVNTSETTALENMKTEGHGIPTFGQIPYVPGKLEGFRSFKTQNIGVDVTEGPWFGQAADDAGNSQLESSIQSISLVEEVAFEEVLAQRQELCVSTETVVQNLVSEIPVSEVLYETLPLNNVVDGEFLGEVVSVSVATEMAVEISNNGAQVESFKFEETEDDIVLADSSAIVKRLEQMVGHETITTMDGKIVVNAPEENLPVDVPTLELPKDQTNVTDLDSNISITDSDSDDGDEHLEVKQSLTPLPAPAEKVALLEANKIEVDDEGQGNDSLDVEEHVKQLLTPLPAPAEKVALLEATKSQVDDEGDGMDSMDVEKHVKQSLTLLPAPLEKVAFLEASKSEVDDEGQGTDSYDVKEHVKQSLTSLLAPAEKVALLEASKSEVDDEGQGTDSLDVEENVKQSLTLLPAPAEKVALLEASKSEVDDEGHDRHSLDVEEHAKQLLTPLPAPVEKVALLEESTIGVHDEGQGTASLDVQEHGETIELLSGVDQTLEKIEAELDDVLDEVSLSIDHAQTVNVEEAVRLGLNHSDGGVASQTTNGPLIATQTKEEPQLDARVSLNQIGHQDSGAMAYGSSANASLQSLEEDPREDNKKALEAAVPALAIGIGTVGTLFGVAGGLQVVGFAAVASFLSQDVFWAQSREELWQEVKGITDRQKLLDFLARRNIVNKDQEESSL